MFTVKHVGDLGEEYLYEADAVAFFKAEETKDAPWSHQIRLMWDGVAESKVLTSGHVYVMNDLGKTVGSYRLSPSYALPVGMTREQFEAQEQIRRQNLHSRDVV